MHKYYRRSAGYVCAILLFAPAVSQVYAQTSNTSTAGLEDAEWQLVMIGQDSVNYEPDDNLPYVKFDANGQASGYSGVNTFTADYKVKDQEIDVSSIAATKIGGSEKKMAVEQGFYSGLETAKFYRIADKNILELSAGEKILLHLSKPAKKK